MTALETDARSAFGELSAAETALLHALGGDAWKNDDIKDIPAADDTDRSSPIGVVRAGILRWLCVRSDMARLVDAKGLRVRRVRIEGDLDLESIKCTFPLTIEDCLIDGTVTLNRAHFPVVRIKNTDAGKVDAVQLRVDASLVLSGLRAKGELKLSGAIINANLVLEGAALSAAEGQALNLEGASIGGSVSMRQGFRSDGHVRFLGTQIGRDIKCDGIISARRAESALTIERARIGGSVLLRNGFRCIGQMRFYRVALEGTLDLQQARLTARGNFALLVYGCRIKGSLVLGNGESKDPFRYMGGIRINSSLIDEHLNLSGARIRARRREACDFRNLKVEGHLLASKAHIDGEFALTGTSVRNDAIFVASRLSNARGWALRGIGFHCGGSLVLGDRFEANGTVDLFSATIGGEFRAEGSQFRCEGRTALNLSEAVIRRVVCSRCKVVGNTHFNAASIGSSLDLSNGVFDGILNLSRIQVGGHLWLRGAKLKADAPLMAGDLRCKGSLFLDDGFEARGGANFYGAVIDGDFVSSKSTYESTKTSLNLQRTRIGGHLLLDRTAMKGIASLEHASVGGQLRLSRATLSAPQKKALNATGCLVGGDLLVDDGFTARGAIVFDRARILGNLRLSNCAVFSRRGVAVSLVGTSVLGDIAAQYVLDVFGFPQARILGMVDASKASVDGSVDLSGMRVFNRTGVALNGERMRVKGALDLRPDFLTNGAINLQDANVGSYLDAESSWSSARGLSLKGLTYHTIAPSDCAQRLRWLERGTQPLDDTDTPDEDPISLQPYEQLISTLKKQGHEHDARKISIAKQAYIGKHGMKGRGERWRHGLYGFTMRYGFRPQRALFFAPFFLAALCTIFYTGADELMIPTNPAVATSFVAGTPLPPGYPSFNAVAYSVEMFVPILNLQQKESWRPNDRAICSRGPTRCGSWLRLYLFFHVAAGWIITTLAVAGFTGLVRKD